MPFVSFCLIAITLVVALGGNPLSLALWPIPSAEFRPWQLVTYAFVHGGPVHLVLNMLALLSFGPALERLWGHKRFLACYALAAGFGGALQALIVDKPVVGASASLFALFAAYTIGNPKARILTLFPWPLAAWKVLLGYTLLTLAALWFGWAAGVAHLAHLGGVIVGAAFACTYNKPPA
jgi:membrane associated rhomboid family serine protease